MNEIARIRLLYRAYILACIITLTTFCFALNLYPNLQNHLTLSLMAAFPAMLGFFAAYYCGLYKGLTGKTLWF